MSKTWTKRKVKCYGGNHLPSVEIEVRVYSRDGLLQPNELKALGDHLADDAMRSINNVPYVHAPLSRINIERNPK